MTIKITQWSPDTCGCVIEYSWDDSTSVEERVHTGHKVVKECEFHSHDNDPQSALTALLNENVNKNQTLQALAQIANADTIEALEDGSKRFKEDKIPEYHFDENRKLVVDISKGFTDKKAAEDLLKDRNIKIKTKK